MKGKKSKVLCHIVVKFLNTRVKEKLQKSCGQEMKREWGRGNGLFIKE